ncbi:MAG: hypothetical protein ACTHQQ_01895 [Solirubrobacteraceae bacterium]
MALLRYFDVAVLIIAAPIMLLIGVPAGGYLLAAGAWIVLRAIGVGVEHAASSASEATQQVGLRLAYMLGRLFLLAIAVIVARQAFGRDAGITALAVVVFAFTVQLVMSALTRGRSR